jgi:hypothetical protein
MTPRADVVTVRSAAATCMRIVPALGGPSVSSQLEPCGTAEELPHGAVGPRHEQDRRLGGAISPVIRYTTLPLCASSTRPNAGARHRIPRPSMPPARAGSAWPMLPMRFPRYLTLPGRKVAGGGGNVRAFSAGRLIGAGSVISGSEAGHVGNGRAAAPSSAGAGVALAPSVTASTPPEPLANNAATKAARAASWRARRCGRAE